MSIRSPGMCAFETPDVETGDLATLFKGFADCTRIRILNLLAAGELCVCDIHDLLSLSQPTVSRHLAYLRRAGLVEVSRRSKYAHYRLARPSHNAQRGLLDCMRLSFRHIESLAHERMSAEHRVRHRGSQPC